MTFWRAYKKFADHYHPVFLCLLIIFIFSSIPQLHSPLPNPYDLIARKIAHMLEYGTLTFFLQRALFGYHRLNFSASLAYALVLSILYASTDEFHQTFVFGREGSLRDVGIDTVGALIALMLLGLQRYGHSRYNTKL